jgi:phage shock protein PspC (stress-responsive transcriptional regulator)
MAAGPVVADPGHVTPTLPPSSPAPSPGLPPPAPPAWRLVRSRDGVVAGVCRGLSVATGVDITLVRLAFIAAALNGFGLIAYAVMALVVPRENPAIGRYPSVAPEETARWIRVVLLVAAILGAASVAWRAAFGWFGGIDPFPFDGHGGPGAGFFLGFVLLVGGLGVIWYRRRHRSDVARNWSPPAGSAAVGSAAVGTAPAGPWAAPATTPVSPTAPSAPGRRPPAAPSRPPLPASVVVLRVLAWLAVLAALAGAAAVGFMVWTGALSLTAPVLVALVAFAAVTFLIVAASAARTVIPVVLALSLMGGTAVLTAALGHWQGGVGQRTVTPASQADVRPFYEFAVGHFVLDLSAVDLGEAPLAVAVDHHVGQLEVVVPADADVATTVDVRAGEARLFGRVDNGRGVEATVRDTPASAAGRLDLDLEMSVGQVVVCRAAGTGGGSCDGER